MSRARLPGFEHPPNEQCGDHGPEVVGTLSGLPCGRPAGLRRESVPGSPEFRRQAVVRPPHEHAKGCFIARLQREQTVRSHTSLGRLATCRHELLQAADGWTRSRSHLRSSSVPGFQQWRHAKVLACDNLKPCALRRNVRAEHLPLRPLRSGSRPRKLEPAGRTGDHQPLDARANLLPSVRSPAAPASESAAVATGRTAAPPGVPAAQGPTGTEEGPGPAARLRPRRSNDNISCRGSADHDC